MVCDAARVKSIFLAAVERYPAEQWPAYLDGACGEDAELRERVERLLGAHGGQRSLHLPPTSPSEDTVDQSAVEQPGEMVGPYKLREQLGEGGMGVVYVAEQHQPVRRKVALKIIKPGMDTNQVVARFEAERQALAMMDHPNIARVHDGGTTASGRPYFVMELVRGMPITDYCDRERLSIRERLELFVQVCRAVQHAHQKGIIHRDLKPSNILVTVIDGIAVPKVIDFGVAKATGASLTERTIYTAFQQFVGTPLYMSPEQADVAGVDVDTRSDIYALGVLLYELLTGTTPFDQETFRTAAFDEMRRIIREQEPPRPSTRLSSLGAARATVSAHRKADARQIDRTVRGELDWIVMKALEKDRRWRYETANDFASDVMRYLTDQPVQACPPSAWYRFGKFAHRNRVALVTTAMVATILVLGTAVSTWQAIRATRAEQTAREQQQAADIAREAESGARKRAQAAESAARAEAEKATAINDFLTKDLLGEADPSKNAVSQRVTLREVLDRAADRVGERFSDRPLIQAALRCTLGETYWSLGAFEQSRQQYAAARALYERELGPDAPETANALVGLGEALRRLNQWSSAEPLLRQALDTLHRARGDEHPDTLWAMHELSSAIELNGQRAESAELNARVLEGCRRVFGPEHHRTLEAMASSAETLNAQGRPSEVERLAIAALETHLRVQGKHHAHTIWYMTVVGQVYQAQGKVTEAERWFARAVEVGRRVLGEDHPHVQQTRQYSANLCKAQGRLADAERLYSQALEGRRRSQGVEHPSTLREMSNLAGVYAARGKWTQAEALLLEILEVRQRSEGQAVPGLPGIVSELASLYRAQGQPARAEAQWAEAEAVLLKAVELRRRTRGEEDPETQQVMGSLATVYEERGKLAQAEPLWRELLAIERRTRSDDPRDPSVSGTLAVLGFCLLRRQRPAEAEPLLRECLAIREAAMPDHWLRYNAMSLLGGALLGQAKYAEAEPLLLAGYEGIKAREGTIPAAGKARPTEALERIVRLYEAWGRPERAAEWRAKLPPALAELPADVFAGP